ncbi:hypothetical protein ENUP19_0039G0014 [Entamoeba nuttalli]|uniref:Uncharacterized protein n=2 Tax=Entamoeba nuttalli TaxID=412467 RepID=K2HG07_ENTNP|nr:hypothetical protein ENU1_044800 [Entamoeba nuttalli P19]EKE41784.1 hypothetical protein ENU1_044800 [Entamoeba nuttalli P19]|eukprot:XP_008855879.1 hypothetical protein ENU1_044800 [Entamoeba nuttalli P19]
MSTQVESSPSNNNQLQQDTKSEEQMSICFEHSPTTPAPFWSEEEQLLLDENIKKLEITEDNLKSIFQISMLFPNKTIQQLTMRVHWLQLKETVSWENYWKTFQRKEQQTPLQSPKDSNHSSPRYKMEKLRNRKSCQFIPKKLSEDQQRRKRKSVPNGLDDSSPISSPDLLKIQSKYQSLNQQTQSDSIQSDLSDPLTQIPGLIQFKGPMNLKHNRGSARFMQLQSLQERNELNSLQYQQQSSNDQIKRRSGIISVMQTGSQQNIPFTSIQQSKILNSSQIQQPLRSINQKPVTTTHITRHQSLPQTLQPRVLINQSIPINSLQLNSINQSQYIINQIDNILKENESILKYIQESIQLNIALNPNYINAFNKNLHSLLFLTDELAKPSSLPFLKLVLSIPPLVSQQISQTPIEPIFTTTNNK